MAALETQQVLRGRMAMPTRLLGVGLTAHSVFLGLVEWHGNAENTPADGSVPAATDGAPDWRQARVI